MSCPHEKVYADHILTSNPPQRDWVCRLCGEEGREVCGSYSGQSEYDEIIGRWGSVGRRQTLVTGETK